jgi:putative ABC transport system permease protein
VREGLVVCQFTVAIAFTIATAVIVSQTRYLRHADIGFDREGLIVVSSFDLGEVTAAQRASLLTAWRALPHVASATAGDIGPGIDESTAAGDFKRPGQPGDGVELNWVSAGPDFFQTYGARLIAGRLPDVRHGEDYTVGASGVGLGSGATPNVVLNALAVRALGFKSAAEAIGATVLAGADVGNGYAPLKVIGVVRDIRFRSPRAPVPPTLYYGRSGDLDEAAAGVRYAGADEATILRELSGAWRRLVPGVPFLAHTSNESLGRYFEKDDQQGRLFTLGAGLAVLIGCVGLYGLASFNTARRVKEIGIRKTLGASTSDILKLLVGQFLRPVILANLFAWPLAWWAMTNYLSGFDQRIALTPIYFLAATALTLLIAVATVGGQAYAVARAEPARALRHE